MMTAVKIRAAAQQLVAGVLQQRTCPRGALVPLSQVGAVPGDGTWTLHEVQIGRQQPERHMRSSAQ